MKLKSIAKEAADCRAAWAAVPDATYGVHIHHGSQPFERLAEPIENRIAYILERKPEQERAARLRHMRPVSEAAWDAYNEALAAAGKVYDEAVAAAVAAAWKVYDEAVDAAWKVYEEAEVAAAKAYDEAVAAAHAELCPVTGCGWDGKSIFGGAA